VPANRRPDDSVSIVGLLAEPTRRRLYELVVASPAPVSRDEAGAAIGISRDLAAFHLDRLAAAGLLETEYRRRSGRNGPGAGRPAKLYRRAATELTVALPPRTYALAAELMAIALDRLEEPSGREALSSVAREKGSTVGAELRARRADKPGDPATTDALVTALVESGYEPIAEPETRSIVLRNCPFHALVAEHRELTCQMNLAWAEGVVTGLGAEATPRLAPRPGRCCVVFDVGAPTSAPAVVESP
jgi:predicted ArsR family transcriptional regulator